jgi:NAD-dependent SIR2 family protein deacetylase
VRCLSCGDVTARVKLDTRLRAANPDLRVSAFESQPDGDAEVADDALADFTLVGCQRCGSELLKPDVVFFGESVPQPRVAACYALVDESALLLVLGSSLTVMSGYRFVLRATERGVPVAIVNQGATRGSPHATVTVDAPLGPALSALVELLEPAVAYQGDGA